MCGRMAEYDLPQLTGCSHASIRDKLCREIEGMHLKGDAAMAA